MLYKRILHCIHLNLSDMILSDRKRLIQIRPIQANVTVSHRQQRPEILHGEGEVA